MLAFPIVRAHLASDATAAATATTEVEAVSGHVEPVDRPWRRAWALGSAMWLISHVMYAAIQFMAWRFIGGSVPGVGQWLRSLANWDGAAYIWIAEHGGYPPITDPTFTSDPLSVYTVWPPMYPVVIWLVAHLIPGVSTAVVSVIVSNLAGLGMLIVLSRFMDRELTRADADRVVLYLIAYPTAFFFAVAYSESVFLLLAFGSLYLARQQRWWIAGILAAACGATRVIGVLIGVALAYEYLRQRDFDWRRIKLNVLALGLAPVGLGLYMVYLWQRYGDPLVFSHAQAFWGRDGITPPWESVAAALDFTNRNAASMQLLDLAATVVVGALLVLGVVGPWRLHREQLALWLLGVMFFIAPLLMVLGPLAGMNRYTLPVLPAFMVLAKIGRSVMLDRLYLFAVIPVQAVLMIQFMRFEWAG